MKKHLWKLVLLIILATGAIARNHFYAPSRQSSRTVSVAPSKPGYDLNVKTVPIPSTGWVLHYGEATQQGKSYSDHAYLAIDTSVDIDSKNKRKVTELHIPTDSREIVEVAVSSAHDAFAALDSQGFMSYYTVDKEGNVEWQWCQRAPNGTIIHICFGPTDNTYYGARASAVFSLVRTENCATDFTVFKHELSAGVLGRNYQSVSMKEINAFKYTYNGIFLGGADNDGRAKIVRLGLEPPKKVSLLDDQASPDLADNSITSLEECNNLLVAGTDKGYGLILDEKDNLIIRRPAYGPVRAVTSNGKLLAALSGNELRFMSLDAHEKTPGNVAIPESIDVAYMAIHSDGTALTYYTEDGHERTIPFN